MRHYNADLDNIPVVDQLQIETLPTGTPVTNLAIDVDGNVIGSNLSVATICTEDAPLTFSFPNTFRPITGGSPSFVGRVGASGDNNVDRFEFNPTSGINTLEEFEVAFPSNGNSGPGGLTGGTFTIDGGDTYGEITGTLATPLVEIINGQASVIFEVASFTSANHWGDLNWWEFSLNEGQNVSGSLTQNAAGVDETAVIKDYLVSNSGASFTQGVGASTINADEIVSTVSISSSQRTNFLSSHDGILTVAEVEQGILDGEITDGATQLSTITNPFLPEVGDFVSTEQPIEGQVLQEPDYTVTAVASTVSTTNSVAFSVAADIDVGDRLITFTGTAPEVGNIFSLTSNITDAAAPPAAENIYEVTVIDGDEISFQPGISAALTGTSAFSTFEVSSDITFDPAWADGTIADQSDIFIYRASEEDGPLEVASSTLCVTPAPSLTPVLQGATGWTQKIYENDSLTEGVNGVPDNLNYPIFSIFYQNEYWLAVADHFEAGGGPITFVHSYGSHSPSASEQARDGVALDDLEGGFVAGTINEYTRDGFHSEDNIHVLTEYLAGHFGVTVTHSSYAPAVPNYTGFNGGTLREVFLDTEGVVFPEGGDATTEIKGTRAILPSVEAETVETAVVMAESVDVGGDLTLNGEQDIEGVDISFPVSVANDSQISLTTQGTDVIGVGTGGANNEYLITAADVVVGSWVSPDGTITSLPHELETSDAVAQVLRVVDNENGTFTVELSQPIADGTWDVFEHEVENVLTIGNSPIATADDFQLTVDGDLVVTGNIVGEITLKQAIDDPTTATDAIQENSVRVLSFDSDQDIFLPAEATAGCWIKLLNKPTNDAVITLKTNQNLLGETLGAVAFPAQETSTYTRETGTTNVALIPVDNEDINAIQLLATDGTANVVVSFTQNKNTLRAVLTDNINASGPAVVRYSIQPRPRLDLPTDNQSFELIYYNDTEGWILIGN